jgi:hypothetical protein
MRTLILGALVSMIIGLGGCDKPTEAECQKAVDNINMLYKANDDETALAQGVRRCRGMSTKATVRCIIAAKTVAEAEACEGKNGKATTPTPAAPAQK